MRCGKDRAVWSAVIPDWHTKQPAAKTTSKAARPYGNAPRNDACCPNACHTCAQPVASYKPAAAEYAMTHVASQTNASRP